MLGAASIITICNLINIDYHSNQQFIVLDDTCKFSEKRHYFRGVTFTDLKLINGLYIISTIQLSSRPLKRPKLCLAWQPYVEKK